MTRIYILFSFFILSSINDTTAQVMDSFLRLISDPEVPSITKAEVSNKVGGYYLSNNLDSAIHYSNLTLKFAKESGDPFQIIDADLLLVSINRDVWPFDSVVTFFNNLLEDPFVKENIGLKRSIYNDLGVLYGDYGDQKKAAGYKIKSYDLALIQGDSIQIARAVINLAVGYFNVSMNESAIEKFKEAVNICHAIDHVSFEAFAYSGLVNVFDNMGEVDSAFYYSAIMKELADSSSLDQMKVQARISIGQILVTRKKYEEALINFIEARDIIETVGDELLTAYCYCNIGAAKYYLGEYQESLTAYEKALSFTIYQNNHLATQACSKELAYTYEKLGMNKKAFEVLNDYVLYQDTVLLKENKEVIASIEAKYNAAVQEAQLEKQQSELDKKTYQRNLISGGFGLSLLLGGSLIWGLVNRSKKNKKIALQADHLKTQKIETLEQEKKLLSMSSLLEGQENERIRIAKDLHDGLGGLLTNVKAHFGKIQSEIMQVENLDIYNNAQDMIDKAYEEVRRISHNLMPADLRVGGLPIAIRQLAHELRNIHEIKTDYELVSFDEERLDEKVELTTYRIIQELISNIVKYADANHVFIQLSRFEKEIQVVVEDDGVGFDYQTALDSTGLGLKSISSRVEQLHGHMDVVTSEGKGTSVTINVPIK